MHFRKRSGSAPAAMVCNTASCRHSLGVRQCRTENRYLLYRCPVTANSPTHGVSTQVRQAFSCRQQKQLTKRSRKSAVGCAVRCAATVGRTHETSKVFKLSKYTCQADPFCAAAVEQLVLQPIKRIEGHVKLPGSKSLSNRILLLAALSEGTTEVQNLLVSTYILPCKSNSNEVI